MQDADIGLFKFDYDLTWAAMFLNGSDRVYSRYGGRDARNAEGRLSIPGLKYTLRQVLQFHRQQPAETTTPTRTPVRPDDLFDVKGKCLHCHQVWEGLRKQARRERRFDPESLYVYPLPENVGLKLDLTEGNKVVSVEPNSPAQSAGLRAGDRLETIRGIHIFSQADVMWVLHTSPAEGKVPAQFTRDGKLQVASLNLPRGWKKPDLSWRPSMRKEKDLPFFPSS